MRPTREHSSRTPARGRRQRGPPPRVAVLAWLGPMPDYDAALSLREARGRDFAANGLGAGGYEESWVRFAVGPVRFAIPNTAGRVRAVRYHDLHHVVTGYATDWTGEGEIGAWEIASGCRDLIAAWVLNLYAMWIGLWISPRAMWQAFARG